MENVNSYLSKENVPGLLLSMGLAFVFLYAGIASLMHPLEWVGYLPTFTGTFIAPDLALKGIAVYEILLGVWLMSGLHRKVAAMLAALTLAGIILTGIQQFIITFRDVGLLFAALALLLSPPSGKRK